MELDLASAGYIQADRILRFESPIGEDILLPEHMEMREAINDLFTLVVSVRSKRPDIKPDEIVGKLVDTSLELGHGERRTWSGMVTRFKEGPAVTRGLRVYQLEIRPRHWLLSQKSDCRIWLDKTSLDVARTLLSEHKLEAPVTSGVIPEPKPQHYSVQYNETDLAYLLRRLEEDGLFYWLEHEGGSAGSVSARHVMHIASHISGYTKGAETDVRFAMGSTDRNHLTKFERSFTYIPGKRSAGDWNFLTPGSVPSGETPSLVSLPGNEAYELYEYPMVGGYGSDSASEGIANDSVERQSKLRMQAAEADYERIEGASTIRTLAPGRRFKPYDVANPENGFEEHVTFQIVHAARDRSYETNEGDPEYSNRFIALPSRVPATPHRITPRPRIDGAQVAIVAGPPGEEIHPDKYGRVKAWFPWDRRAKKDGTDTCWIRAMQNWAGGQWGGQIIPRIGMEVMVAYLEGDPDRPVIQGVVPNERQQVPYALPANKTRSVFKTKTHKGTGYNELRFEDKENEEEIFLRAQKDMNSEVENNKHTYVGNNLSENVYGFRIQQTILGHINNIGAASFENVGGDKTLNVGFPNLTLENMPVQYRHLATFNEFANMGMSFGAGNYTINTAGDLHIKSHKMIRASADSSIVFQSKSTVNMSGTDNVVISSGQKTLIEGEKNIVIHCGDIAIGIDINGNLALVGKRINIFGENIKIEATKHLKLIGKHSIESN